MSFGLKFREHYDFMIGEELDALVSALRRFEEAFDDATTTLTLSSGDVDAALAAHLADTSNPHSVTTTQIGAVATITFNDHSARHENGGADEISVTGLSGLLADNQTAVAHNVLDGSRHGDTVAQSVTRGSLIYGNSTPKWDELTVGAANTVLQSDGTDVGWSIIVTSGKYTPTLTNVANLDASTAYECQYMRVGSIVNVSGKVDVDPTAAVASTQLGISLPIASNIGANEDCSGTAFASGIAAQGAAILGDATNNRAQMQWISGDVTSQPMFFTFQYEII